jgi:hypothetical protein
MKGHIILSILAKSIKPGFALKYIFLSSSFILIIVLKAPLGGFGGLPLKHPTFYSKKP